MVIEIGSEAPARPVAGGEETAEVARKYNAPFFVLEHRFFSDKAEYQPLKDVSTESLRYLTTYNALFDLINFIFDIDEEYRDKEGKPPVPEGTLTYQWIILGGSYPGALAGFIAQQFPHVFTATVSSSGVVNAMYNIPEFDEQIYAGSGNICAKASSIAMRELQDIVNKSPNSNWVYDELGIKGPIDVTDFAYYMADSNVMGIQYAKWHKLCDPMIEAWKEGTDLKKAFITFLKDYRKGEDQTGFATYDRNNLKKDDLEYMSTSVFRNWWYMTCTEWAFFQPMPEHNPLRVPEVTLQWHKDVCEDVFGKNATPAGYGDPTIRTNRFYGSTKVYGPRTIFVNFWQDPWHICSITEPTENAPHVIFVKSFDFGHCADFHVVSSSEDEEMTAMRKAVFDFIDEMVNDYRNTHV